MPVKEKRSNTQKRYQKVRDEYCKLSEVLEFGKKKYTNERIIAELAERFFYSEKTVKNIVFNRV